MREHWGGCRSSSSCLMIIGLTAGTAGGTHRLRRSDYIGTMEGDGRLDSSGPQQPGEALGGQRVTSGALGPGTENGTGEFGAPKASPTRAMRCSRGAGRLSRT